MTLDLRRLHEARVGRLATIRPDGRPRLVPCCFAVSAEEPLTLVTPVDAKPKTSTRLARVGDIRRRPDVSLLVDHYSDDWSQLWWTRLDGVARVVEPETTALVALRAKYPQYRTMPVTAVIEIAVTSWREWVSAGPTD